MQYQSHPAKVASTASGMSFEQWKNRPVYKAQCHTESIARQLCGIHLRPGEGLGMVLGERRADGLTLFRCLPPYRDEAAKGLRRRVAEFVLSERRKARADHAGA